MRWLLRLVLFWAISASLGYVFGLPALTDYMTKKIRVDGYRQCIDELTKQGQLGSANASLSQQQGDGYCHCVSDTLVFTKEDFFDMLPKNGSEFGQQKQPKALTALAQKLADTCHRQLLESQGLIPAEQKPANGTDSNILYIN